jgi:hypothetical protein
VNTGSEGSCTRSCIRVHMRVMGGGGEGEPQHRDIENEEKIKKLTQKSHFCVLFNSSFDCHCELCKQSWVQSSVKVESLGWQMKEC